MTRAQPRFAWNLHGLQLEVTAPEPILDAVKARFQHLPSGSGQASDMQFEYIVRSEAPDQLALTPPAMGRIFYKSVDGTAIYSTDSDCCYFELGAKARALCFPTEGRCTVYLLEPSIDQLWTAAHPLLTLALLEMLKRRGIFFIHAASLSAEGRCVLFSGTSGSGKSTLTIALLRAGFGFMGDDLSLLDTRTAFSVLAFLEPISVTDQTLQFFPEILDCIDTSRSSGYPKYEIRSESVSAQPVCWTSEPAALVFLQIGNADMSALTGISSDEALFRLAPNLLLTHKDATQAHLDALTALVKRVPSAKLRTGTDFERVGELLRCFFTRS
jgi:hypothetical protein